MYRVRRERERERLYLLYILTYSLRNFAGKIALTAKERVREVSLRNERRKKGNGECEGEKQLK